MPNTTIKWVSYDDRNSIRLDMMNRKHPSQKNTLEREIISIINICVLFVKNTFLACIKRRTHQN